MGLIFLGALPCIGATVGASTARAYQATWEQAFVYTTADLAVNMLFTIYFMPCSINMSSRKAVVMDLTGRIISCLSGILATRLVCQKTIQWRQAIIAQFAYLHSISIIAQFFYGDCEYTPMKV